MCIRDSAGLGLLAITSPDLLHRGWSEAQAKRWSGTREPSHVERLLSHLGRGRSGVAAARHSGEDQAPYRRRVDLAKHGLGERGTPWWEQSDAERERRWTEALHDLDALDDQGEA